MRPTRGGARSASWLTVLATIGIVAGLMEPVQQRLLLFVEHDLLLTLVLYASYVTWIALVMASVLRARAGVASATSAVPANEVAPAIAAPAAA
jgi:hypothetical protein